MIVLYQLLYFFFFLGTCIVSLFSSKVKKGLWGRRGLVGRLEKCIHSLPKDTSRVLFHVASAGEFEQALPLMDQLKRSSSPPLIFLTYFSPSGQKAVSFEIKRRQRLSMPLCWDFADFSPFDFWVSVNRFISVLKPSALILIHKEVWPCLLIAAHKRGVPCFLWLARFTQTVPRWLQPLLALFSDIGVVDSSSVKLLENLDSTLPVRFVGDTRLERILFRKKYFSLPQTQVTDLSVPADKKVIAASFWDEDFEVLNKTLFLLLNRGISFPLLLVPHEPTSERVKSWQQSLSPNIQKAFSIQILNQVGILAELYAQASIVMVGGSFKKRVHNVLEPLVYHCLLVTGPHISNSREACDLLDRQILQRAKDERELAHLLETLTGDSHLKEEVQQRLTHYLENYVPCSGHYLEALKIH